MAANRQPGQSTGTARSTRREDSARKAREAADLRLSGLDFDTIAERLGYADKSGAWRAVERVMEDRRHEAGIRLMALELARLDRLLEPVWTQAMQGNLGAVDRVLRIMERRARLLALDGGPTEDGLQRAVGNLSRAEAVARMAALEGEILRRTEKARMLGIAEAPYMDSVRAGTMDWREAARKLERSGWTRNDVVRGTYGPDSDQND